jgi:hypothetical protein
MSTELNVHAILTQVVCSVRIVTHHQCRQTGIQQGHDRVRLEVAPVRISQANQVKYCTINASIPAHHFPVTWSTSVLAQIPDERERFVFQYAHVALQ